MIHKQVSYKDFTVDIEMLPLIENLNENGIQTLYSCCGLDEDGNKDKPAKELIKKNLRPYVIISADEKGYMFTRLLLLVQYKYLTSDKDSIKIPLIEIDYDYYEDTFRFTIQGVNSCSFKIFEFFMNETLRLFKEIDYEKMDK